MCSGKKKNSFDASQSVTRSKSNAHRDRYYSIANTRDDLKKVDIRRQQKRNAKEAMKQQKQKTYIKSRRNLFQGVDDSKDTEEADTVVVDEAMSDNETPLSPVSETEMKEKVAAKSKVEESKSPDTVMQDKRKPLKKPAKSQHALGIEYIADSVPRVFPLSLYVAC